MQQLFVEKAKLLNSLRQGDSRLRVALRLAVYALIILISGIEASAQPGTPKPTSPLYGARPESGPVASGLPQQLQDIKIEQRLNETIPADITFKDETGKTVQIGQYFGSKPVILAHVYYECPMLCNQVLNGLLSSMKGLSFSAGKEFDVLAVSFDPRETPEMARSKRKIYVDSYRREGTESGWHFLTGSEESIKRLTDTVGFKYTYDPATNQFAHASGIMLITPEGKLGRYFYGIDYQPRALRLGLVEASQNKIGSPVDQLLLYCYHYDPATGKYGPVVMNIIRLGGIITLVAIAALLFLLRKRVWRPVGPLTGGGAA